MQDFVFLFIFVLGKKYNLIKVCLSEFLSLRRQRVGTQAPGSSDLMRQHWLATLPEPHTKAPPGPTQGSAKCLWPAMAACGLIFHLYSESGNCIFLIPKVPQQHLSWLSFLLPSANVAHLSLPFSIRFSRNIIQDGESQVQLHTRIA